jgi:hypothetical protein
MQGGKPWGVSARSSMRKSYRRTRDSETTKLDVTQHVGLHGGVANNADFMKIIGDKATIAAAR